MKRFSLVLAAAAAAAVTHLATAQQKGLKVGGI